VISSADSYDARIFFDPLAATDNVSGLAVNLANATLPAAPGAVNLRTQTAEAQTQTWSFV